MKKRILVIFFLLLAGFSFSAVAMEFRHGGARAACRDSQACAFWIDASGEFTAETDKEFLAFLRKHPSTPYSIIRFNSEGGNVQSAIRLGLALRSRNFTTEANFCASACLYAFLGGVERKVVGDKPRLGIHRFYHGQAMLQPKLKQFSGEDMDDTQRLMAGLLLYTSKMGVDPRLMALSIQAGPTQMRWLNLEELSEYKVVYEPNAWAAWRVVVPTNSVGLIAVSETQNKARSMQISCTNGQAYFVVTEQQSDESEWFEQCKSIITHHSVLGTVVPSDSVSVLNKPSGIAFKLPKHRVPLNSASIFTDQGSEYPMACQTDRYLGTTLELRKMATLALRNCVE